MSSIPTIVSDLEFGRAKLLEAINGLSRHELTEIPIYEGWTIKDVLAHVIGWDRRVISTLPLMLQNRAGEVAGVDVDLFNQESVNAWRDKSLAEVRAEIQSTHRYIVEIIAGLDHKEIDLRRERHGRIITIRSYVIDVMTDHDREHAAEIELWRKNLEQSVDPEALKAALVQNREAFMTTIEGSSEADRLEKNTIGAWSVKDVVGHVADWEQLMLDAAAHIHDPSLPQALFVGEAGEDWNEILAAKRAGTSWSENWLYLTALQAAVEDFLTGLRPGDWILRGPYPWPNDQGTVAELVWHMSEHYVEHIPDLQKWRGQ